MGSSCRIRQTPPHSRTPALAAAMAHRREPRLTRCLREVALDDLSELGAETAPEIRQRGRLLRAQLREQPIVRYELTLPRIALEAHDLLEAAGAEVQSPPFKIAVFGLQSECGLHGVRLSATAIDDPFQHAHVLTESRPRELAVLVGAKPVDIEHLL